jgi:hypothetical protein
MRLSITTNDPRAPRATPVAVVDLDTMEIQAFHKNIIDATKHRALLEGKDLATSPDLFARSTIAITMPPTVAW